MSEVHPLVPGVIKDIADGHEPPSVWLQIIFIKPMEKDSSGRSRYKIAVSDSRNFIQAMVVSPMSQALDNKMLEQYSIIRATTYKLNMSKGHLFLVLFDCALEDTIKAGTKYGDPVLVQPSNPPAGELKSSDDTTHTCGAGGITTYTGSIPPSVVAPAPSKSATSPPNPFQSNIGKYDAIRSSNITLGGGNGSYEQQPDNLQSIAHLSPYHNRWAIKARIINKSDIKKFANQKGEGKLFSTTCIDSTGEIRMTAFGESVDKFFDLVQEGQVYIISNAQVKIAKRQFGVRNEYEIHLEPNSLISLVGNSGEIPQARFNFVPIAQITNLEKDAICDVIGIVKEIGELSSITTKTTQKQLNKRDLVLADTSGCAIKVTLWGAQAESFGDTTHLGNYPIMAIRSARVSDYNGRTLSTSLSSTISMNPDIREAHELRGWFDDQGVRQEARSISVTQSSGQTGPLRDDRKTISQIKDDQLGLGERPDFFSLYATIVYIKSDANVSYTACPAEGCNKKVIEDGPNMWRCEKCQKIYDRCDHRYILSLQVADHTGQTWVNAFNETGEHLLGKSAEELYYLKMNNRDAEYSAVFKEALFKPYIFRIRAKQENYQGEMKLRCNVMAALPVNSEEECKFLIDKIERFA